MVCFWSGFAQCKVAARLNNFAKEHNFNEIYKYIQGCSFSIRNTFNMKIIFVFLFDFITFQHMQTYWCLAATGWLAGVISLVSELDIVDGEETQGSSPITFINWAQHLCDNMDSSIRVQKPGVMNVPENNISCFALLSYQNLKRFKWCIIWWEWRQEFPFLL